MQILLSKNAIAIYEILIILLLVIILVRQSKKNKDMQERKRIRKEKLRNAQLEERLKNPEIDIEQGWPANPNPFDVQYVHSANIDTNAMPRFQVEIEVHTETSVQRYLFDLDQEITIGRDERSVLPLKDPTAARRGCSILMKNQVVYVKNESTVNAVCIQRGKNKKLIQNQMVKLQSRDILTIGKTALHVSIYEN